MTNLKFYFSEATTSLRRNRVLSLATVFTVTICVLVLGISLLVYLNTGHFVKQLESNVEMVVFLDNNLSRTEVKAFATSLENLPGVDKVQFVPRDDSLKELESRFAMGADYDLDKTLGGDNPLPDTYRVKANDPHQVSKLAKSIEVMPGVTKIRYGQGIIDKLFAVTSLIRNVSLTLVILLGAGAVFLIANTIRLAIFARRKEIYLMRLVGATNWFIRWPFFIEGIFLGLIGALLATGLVYSGYSYLLANVGVTAAFMPLIDSQTVINKLMGALVGSGVVLGLLGTWISVNRYLKV
ncbi:MAG: permease-like cell division protein FtsX [Methylocystaceae bacterium]